MARTGGQRGASPTATWQVSPSAHGHHRWMQANDASLHAPHGVLPRDDDGRVCCHLCGRWFVALGAHVKVHSYTADAYRRAMGLLSSRGLVATPLSEQIRRRTRDRYESTAEVRQDLAPGQELARSRQLAGADTPCGRSCPSPHSACESDSSSWPPAVPRRRLPGVNNSPNDWRRWESATCRPTCKRPTAPAPVWTRWDAAPGSGAAGCARR